MYATINYSIGQTYKFLGHQPFFERTVLDPTQQCTGLKDEVLCLVARSLGTSTGSTVQILRFSDPVDVDPVDSAKC